MATTTFKIGDITIHRMVEQEGPFFNPLEFFPSLTPEVLEENRGWMTEGGYLDRQSGQLVLCIQSYLVQTPHHNILIDSCVGNHKPRPTRPFWNMMNTDRFEKGLAAHRRLSRSDRLCDVHASARRPCRLEHQAGEWPLGSDLPEGQVCLRRPRTRLLDRDGKERSIGRPLDHGLRPSHRRRQARGSREERPPVQRYREAAPDTGPHHRSLLGAGRQTRRGRGDHRRHDPLAIASALS